MLGEATVRRVLPPRADWLPSAELVKPKLVEGRLMDSSYRIQLAEYICSLLPAYGRCRIVDVGSGEGRLAALIQEHRPNTSVTCVDTFIRTRRERSLPVVRIDGAHLPFADASFDVALLINVLHHAANLRGLLREVSRVSRRRIVIKDHLANSWAQRQQLAILDVLGNCGSGAVVKGRYLSDSEWDSVFAQFQDMKVGRYDGLRFRNGWVSRVFPNQLEILFTLDRREE
jgi:SAM-dependent methyltransferase